MDSRLRIHFYSTTVDGRGSGTGVTKFGFSSSRTRNEVRNRIATLSCNCKSPHLLTPLDAHILPPALESHARSTDSSKASRTNGVGSSRHRGRMDVVNALLSSIMWDANCEFVAPDLRWSVVKAGGGIARGWQPGRQGVSAILQRITECCRAVYPGAPVVFTSQVCLAILMCPDPSVLLRYT
jgi:hypothetical protein